MNPIETILNQMTGGGLLGTAFWNQILIILALFWSGCLFLTLWKNKMEIGWKILLSYPIGLSIWSLCGFLLLVTGVPFSLPYIGVLYGLLFITSVILKWKRWDGIKTKYASGQLLFMILLFLIIVAIAAIVCSGLIAVSISNDTVYYYSLYPQTLVKEGCYRTDYDVFLTDIGQITAIINTLPFFFGFDETFGIQLFLGGNMIGIFFMAARELLLTHYDKQKANMGAFLAALFLTSSTPFLVMTKWVLANAYFMTFLFLVFYLAYKMEKEGEREYLLISSILLAALSMMRMEGGMMACLLILCISSLHFSNKEIIRYYLFPTALMQISYYLMIYLKLKVDPLYSFLDIKKAAIMLLMLVGVFVYLKWVRGRILLKFQENIESVLIVGLLAGNGLLCLLDSQRYLTNLICFGKNIILQNGWGYFGFFILIFLLMIPVTERKPSYPALFSIGFILFTFAVCWARSGTLRIGIGDSGNRILMQITPFLIFAVLHSLVSFDKWFHKES